MDVDLTSLVDKGDAGFEGNLVFEGILGSTTFAVLELVGLLCGTFETLRIEELRFIGGPGGTGSSKTGSVTTSDGLVVETSVSCGYSWAIIDALSIFGSKPTGYKCFFRIILR